MADIVAELRQMYEDSTTDGDRSWVHGGVVNERGCVLFSGRRCIEVGTIFSQEDADLIVAMHEALPALLRMVESLRLYVRHMEQDNPDDPDQWIYLMGRRWEAIVAALAKLKQDGDA